MNTSILDPAVIDRLYAGWAGKVIGVRLGAPVEGWTASEIRKAYGKIDGYLKSWKNFAADDDTNVPIFLIRAMERVQTAEELTSQDIADELMNAAPYEHGFFWWGGYGISTEHTAYLNLMNGIPAPAAGSILQSGKTVAEQIGGQIFIDVWGLISPGRPETAARLAGKAASVTHDGNAVFGGIFIACCISIAYEEQDMETILNRALEFIPADCEYARVVRAVMDYHRLYPVRWEDCYQYILEHFGYDRYPGNCHIIPNAAVIVLALLYGEGGFDATLNIGTMCGWDTDCNVGNIGTIMGVRGGTASIDYEKWLAPIQDLMICSSVIGCMNLQDNAQITDCLLRQMEKVTEKSAPKPLHSLIHSGEQWNHFEYPGSIQAMRSRVKGSGSIVLRNTAEASFSGNRCLRISGEAPNGLIAEIYKKTYYFPSDFSDSRYDPAFSPTVYPGQTLHLTIRAEQNDSSVSLFAKDSRQGRKAEGEEVRLTAGRWTKIDWQIPTDRKLELIDEVGLTIHRMSSGSVRFFLDDFCWNGKPDYAIHFERERLEDWRIGNHPSPHFEISQFTRWKGITFLEDGCFHITGEGTAAALTGAISWKDYTVRAEIVPLSGPEHALLFRAQGAMRAYAFGFREKEICLLKNENGWRILSASPFSWEHGTAYRLMVRVHEGHIQAFVNDEPVLEDTDTENVLFTGCIGLMTRRNSHLKCRFLTVQ